MDTNIHLYFLLQIFQKSVKHLHNVWMETSTSAEHNEKNEMNSSSASGDLPVFLSRRSVNLTTWVLLGFWNEDICQSLESRQTPAEHLLFLSDRKLLFKTSVGLLHFIFKLCYLRFVEETLDRQFDTEQSSLFQTAVIYWQTVWSSTTWYWWRRDSGSQHQTQTQFIRWGHTIEYEIQEWT